MLVEAKSCDDMFKKPKPPTNKNALSERVRRLAGPTSIAIPSPEPTPRRNATERTPRQPVYKNGALLLEGGHKLKVVIKNLSDTGAYVEFFVKTDLPHHVILSEPTLPLKRWARVVWQRDGAAGLVFMAER